jgi:molybdopterin-binding protein
MRFGSSRSTSLPRMKISARNQLAGTVRSITEGAAIANVELDVGGNRVVASITVEAVHELGLSEGSEVVAVIKASDVLLALPD